jgi:cell division protein FtsB
LKYNQCVANQGSDAELNEIRNSYESEIAKLTSENIRLERRIAKLKNALAAIISTY